MTPRAGWPSGQEREVSPEGARRIVGKLAVHLRTGTLASRIATELRRWASPRSTLRERAQVRLADAWQQVEGTEDWVDVRILGGATLRLHGDSVLGGYICRQAFEAEEMLFLHRYLRPGEVFVDVGANLGLFTVAAARRVGSRGRVLAFEPGSRARQRLEENVSLNRLANTTVLHFALSSSDARQMLSVPVAGHEAFGSLAEPIAVAEAVREEIEAREWDGIERELLGSRAVTMMKIDVEGWESQVLAGASAMLRRDSAPLLQVEFTDAAARNAGGGCAHLYDQLRELGFEVCRYEAASNRLIPEDVRAEYPYVNLFATKNLSAAIRRLQQGARRPALWPAAWPYRLLGSGRCEPPR